MKAIAMKCTQEQFDSIKDRIPLRVGTITNFETDSYLVNYFSSGWRVSNLYSVNKRINREVIEEFDGDYFLQCCGVEVLEDVSEQVWNGSEMQIKHINDNEWYDCIDEYFYRLKPRPNLDDDIEALQSKAKELGIKLTILVE